MQELLGGSGLMQELLCFPGLEQEEDEGGPAHAGSWRPVPVPVEAVCSTLYQA
jgi:hypothetical protein